MLTVVTFVAGLVATVALGAPLVSRVASPQAWRGWRKGQPSDAVAPVKHKVIRAFQPLDLGPDPMVWPSERPWEPSRLAEAEWPSRAWNDEHFGAHWRKEGAAAPVRERLTDGWFEGADEAVQAGKRAVGRVKDSAQEKAKAAMDEVARAQALAAQTARKAASAAQQAAKVAESKAPKAVKAAARKAEEAARKVESGAKKAQHVAEGAAEAVQMARSALDGRPPSREEIQKLVDEFGLAGAVKQIMDRTGWDFRAAAQYLSQNR